MQVAVADAMITPALELILTSHDRRFSDLTESDPVKFSERCVVRPCEFSHMDTLSTREKKQSLNYTVVLAKHRVRQHSEPSEHSVGRLKLVL